ncbi:V-type proton ATPase 16 kDa proteolipid subunit, partial [Perkinsus olseni]
MHTVPVVGEDWQESRTFYLGGDDSHRPAPQPVSSDTVVGTLAKVLSMFLELRVMPRLLSEAMHLSFSRRLISSSFFFNDLLVDMFAASTALAACEPSSAFFGFMGITAAISFANLGAAYGTAKSGVGICSMGVMRPDLVMRSIIPVVMAGVLGIYGLITSVIINGKMDTPATYSQYSGYAHLGAGLTVGLSSLAAGLAIGIVGDSG